MVAYTTEHNVFYGARAPKIAQTANCDLKQAQKYIDDFWEVNHGVKKAVDRLGEYYRKNKFSKGIDGRKLMIRAEYRVFNTVIQNAAGVIFKRWGLITNKRLREERVDCKQIIAYHDEYEYRCHPDHEEHASMIIKESAAEAGRYYNLFPPISVDVKSGHNWAEVH